MQTASLHAIATSVAEERRLDVVLERIVIELSRQPQIALTRLWLIEAADRCATCAARERCRDQTRCLHLAASAGTPFVHAADWSRLDGSMHRVPLREGKVGWMAATGQSVLLEEVADDQHWIVDRQWAESEGIVSFAGHPLRFRGELLGVLAVFSRDRLDGDDFERLRGFADQAAIAIANARAFAEIDRLRRQLESENRYLREEVNEAHAFGEIVGTSPAWRKVIEQVELVAPTTASVLILGQSGTGKELIARAIHRQSLRSDRPLVKVNCAAVPRELFESEFFGHVKGSFTGALRDRVGLFQLANGGTLFLDEVGEIPLDLQGKLLRVLQEGQIERVGDDETRSVDVRIIAATNRNLAAEAAAGRFRQDLYFRLSVFPIEILPLADRRDDIPLLAQHFLKLAGRPHRNGLSLSRADIALLRSYLWPGNVRELQNVIERAVISSRDGRLHFESLVPQAGVPSVADSSVANPVTGRQVEPMTREQLRELEAANLLAALEQTNWKVYGPRGAAELLGMRPTTLASRLKKYGLVRPAKFE
jgi:transcriptional regulator with GAF, ATPase, and Fis domain